MLEPGLTRDGSAGSWLPSFDLHEEDGEIVLHVDLDGLAGEDFDVALDGDRLLLRASGSGRCARLALPFVPQALSRGHAADDGLEVRLRAPEA
jgi:hypothetical protein